jgi:hypothetical protein
LSGRKTIRIRLLAPLVGAVLLTGLAIASLPWKQDLFRRPRTPFDRSAASSVAPLYAMLAGARAAIPDGASVVARTEPPNAIQETYFHRFAISFLPGRRVLPSASYGGFLDPQVWKDAQYMVVVGPRPVPPPGRLVLETPEGTVWRRDVP